jgi:hypothetical protein
LGLNLLLKIGAQSMDNFNILGKSIPQNVNKKRRRKAGF